MQKKVTFEVKNGAYNPDSIHRTVYWAIKGCLEIPAEKADEVSEGIGRLSLENYYMDGGKGPKVTKPIKKVLVRVLGKEAVEKVFPELCKGIAELYSPKMMVKAYWGKKSLLGSGKWEGVNTCFAKDGCNNVSRVFLEKFNRTRALVLKNEEDERANYARCIAFFAGGADGVPDQLLLQWPAEQQASVRGGAKKAPEPAGDQIRGGGAPASHIPEQRRDKVPYGKTLEA